MNHHFTMGHHGALSVEQVLRPGHTCSVSGIADPEAHMQTLIDAGLPGCDLRPMQAGDVIDVAVSGPMPLLELSELMPPPWGAFGYAPLWWWLRLRGQRGAVIHNYDTALRSFIEWAGAMPAFEYPLWLSELHDEAVGELRELG